MSRATTLAAAGSRASVLTSQNWTPRYTPDRLLSKQGTCLHTKILPCWPSQHLKASAMTKAADGERCAVERNPVVGLHG
jgi:hypothetical protein